MMIWDSSGHLGRTKTQKLSLKLVFNHEFFKMSFRTWEPLYAEDRVEAHPDHCPEVDPPSMPPHHTLFGVWGLGVRIFSVPRQLATLCELSFFVAS